MKNLIIIVLLVLLSSCNNEIKPTYKYTLRVVFMDNSVDTIMSYSTYEPFIGGWSEKTKAKGNSELRCGGSTIAISVKSVSVIDKQSK